MRSLTPFIITVCFVLGNGIALAEDIPAFPGAEGNGANTPGGRGGTVYLVTTLEDNGPGSLREACEAEGPRMVVINIDGIIELESPIEIRNPFITIAGQAAPGDGICLKNHGLNVTTDDVIIRYLRIRPGDQIGAKTTGINITDSDRVILDHCSISWTAGPGVSVSADASDITLQWCMFTESLFDPNAMDAKPGTGVSLDAESSTFSVHHNYFAHNNTGNPYISGAAAAPGPTLDFRNNIVYDWGVRSGNSANNVARYNIIGNAYKAGPSTPYDVRAKAFRFGSLDSRIYAKENALEGSDMVSTVNFLMWIMPEEFIQRIHFRVFETKNAFEADPVTTLPQESLLRRVLREAGATRPTRDPVDARVLAQYRLGAGRLINTPTEAQGWPVYEPGDPIADTDKDGMPDKWEESFGLSPSDPSDHATDPDEDGYTNIEEYLNSTEPAPTVN